MSLVYEVNNLTKVYRTRSEVETKALDNVSLKVQEGDFMAIAGPSGSGKTTLLNILGGLDTPTSGDVILDGAYLNKMNAGQLADLRLHRIGFVFQAYNLIPTLTVLENTEYVSFLQGATRKHRDHDAMSILKDLGLDIYARRKPAQLSGGQQQRAAVARAILAHPKVILADEPTANLDSRTGEDLVDLMYRMNQNLGMTFVFSTHDKMVMDKATTLIKLHDGRISE
ncbi:MAG: ABC transporter ATP-binding protein [Deltaproteobacteria bacterium]